MDDRLSVFLWTFGGGLAFAVTGAAFGGVAGGVNARHGRTGGTILGRRLANAVARLFRGDLSDVQRGVLVGACDGAIFLGIVGVIIGLVADQAGYDPANWLAPVFLVLLGAACLAMIFGVIAFGLSGRGWQSLSWLVFGGMAGMLVAIAWIGRDHLVPCSAGGMVVGSVIGLAWPRRRRD